MIFKGIAKGLLTLQYRCMIRLLNRSLGKLFKQQVIFLQPCGIRLGSGQLLLDLLIRNNPLLFHIKQEHFARLQTTLLDHLLRSNRQHAGLGGHDHPIIAGNVVAAGTQAVTVQHRADAATVSEADRSRAVPGLHQTGMILIEGTLLIIHPFVALPRLRHHHHHGVGQ